MSYIDPKTKIQYPDKEWMFAHIDTLPEVRKAYPNYKAQKELPAGDLEHTLPPEETKTAIGGLGLPADGKVDKLTLLGLALKNISRKALEKRKASATMGMIGTAGAAMGKFEKMGFDPSRMPGGFSGRIISMARQKAAEQLAKGKGEITQQFDTLETILGSIKESTEREQDLARQNLGILMQTRSLSTLGDKELENLSNVAGVPLEQLTAIKNAESADKNVTDAYIQGIESGKIDISSVPSDMRNDVVAGIDWGEITEEKEGTEEGTEERAGGMVEFEDGTQVDLTTPDGLKKAMDAGYSPAYLKGLLDTNTKLSISTINDLLDETSEKDEKSFLTPDYFKNIYSTTEQMLKVMDKERSEYGKWLETKAQEEEKIISDFNDYIWNNLMPIILQYRKAGLSDTEILDKFPKK